MYNVKRTQETISLGKSIKGARDHFGYTRTTFGMMLGFTPKGSHRNIQGIEQDLKGISEERVAKIARWLRDGLPDDAPEPDLSDARAKGARLHRELRDKREAEEIAQNTPREIILRGKGELD